MELQSLRVQNANLKSDLDNLTSITETEILSRKAADQDIELKMENMTRPINVG